MASPAPNHHASHPDHPHTVDIYVADSHAEKALDTSPAGVRARDSLAIKYREEVRLSLGVNLRYVTPGVRLKRIDRSDDPDYGEPPVRMGPGGIVLDDE